MKKVFTIQAVCIIFTRCNRNIGHFFNAIILTASDTHSEAEDFIFIEIFVIYAYVSKLKLNVVSSSFLLSQWKVKIFTSIFLGQYLSKVLFTSVFDEGSFDFITVWFQNSLAVFPIILIVIGFIVEARVFLFSTSFA